MMVFACLRRSAWSLVPVIAVALAAGCDRQQTPAGGATSRSTAATSTAPASGSSDEPILIGHFASKTGSEATWGVSTDYGVNMAVDEENANGGVGGRPLKVITYDNQGKAQESATAVTRLITQDRVVAVLGEVASSRSIAGAYQAQRFNTPMISPSSTNPKVTEIGDMIFRVCFIDPFQGYVCAKYARDGLKAERAATLFNRSQIYSTGLNDTFKKHFTEMGGSIATEQAYADGDTDYSAQLTNIRGATPDVIFIPGYYTDVVNIAVQARRLGITVPLLGGDGWDAEDLKNAGSALDGCFFCNHYSHDEDRPVVKEFVKRYQALHDGRIPDGMAATGYDSAKLLIDAMRRAKSLGGKDLAAAIAATKDFPGVTGVITIDAQRNARKPAVILRIQGGKTSYVTTVEPPP